MRDIFNNLIDSHLVGKRCIPIELLLIRSEPEGLFPSIVERAQHAISLYIRRAHIAQYVYTQIAEVAAGTLLAAGPPISLMILRTN